MEWSESIAVDGKGVEQGRQSLTLEDPGRVEYRLPNRGPGGREMTPPGLRQLAEALIWRRVRALHVKDLELLKVHVEQQPAAG